MVAHVIDLVCEARTFIPRLLLDTICQYDLDQYDQQIPLILPHVLPS